MITLLISDFENKIATLSDQQLIDLSIYLQGAMKLLPNSYVKSTYMKTATLIVEQASRVRRKG